MKCSWWSDESSTVNSYRSYWPYSPEMPPSHSSKMCGQLTLPFTPKHYGCRQKMEKMITFVTQTKLIVQQHRPRRRWTLIALVADLPCTGSQEPLSSNWPRNAACVVPAARSKCCSSLSNALLLFCWQDSPEAGVLYLLRGLLNVLQDYTWDTNSDARVIAYTRVLAVLSAYSQEDYPSHVDKGERVSALYQRVFEHKHWQNGFWLAWKLCDCCLAHYSEKRKRYILKKNCFKTLAFNLGDQVF